MPGPLWLIRKGLPLRKRAASRGAWFLAVEAGLEAAPAHKKQPRVQKWLNFAKLPSRRGVARNTVHLDQRVELVTKQAEADSKRT
jgi:hypothetical protein